MIKYLLIPLSLLLAQTTFAQEGTDTIFPVPVGQVNDFDQVLDAATEKKMTKLITGHEKKTTNQIAVVTISSIQPYDDFNDYAIALSNDWGVGVKGKDNGVSIVFSKNLRKVRISTGYGLERKLTDAQCKKIIDELMVPAFKKGDYSKGLMKGVKEVIRLLEAPE